MKKNIIFLFLLFSILTFTFNSVDEIKLYSKQISKDSYLKYKKQTGNYFEYKLDDVRARVFYKDNTVTKLELRVPYYMGENKGTVINYLLYELGGIIGLRREIVEGVNWKYDALYYVTDDKAHFELNNYTVYLEAGLTGGSVFNNAMSGFGNYAYSQGLSTNPVTYTGSTEYRMKITIYEK
jgi:hypothetical protein